MNRITKALADTASRRLFRASTVTAVTEHGPRFRTIDLSGNALQGVDWRIGDKIQVRTDPDGWAMRTYTPLSWDPARGSTSLLAYAHGSGPGSVWTETVEVGSPCQLFGPRRSLALDHGTAPIVFVGDETSFALAAAWHAQHPDTPAVAELFEVDDPDAFTPALEAVKLSSPQLFPATAGSAHLDQLCATLTDLMRTHPEATLCLTGRAQSIAAIRRSLKDAGLANRSTLVKAYWDEKRAGLD